MPTLRNKSDNHLLQLHDCESVLLAQRRGSSNCCCFAYSRRQACRSWCRERCVQRRHTCSMLCMVSRPLLARGRFAAAAAAAAAARASGPISCSIACAMPRWSAQSDECVSYGHKAGSGALCANPLLHTCKAGAVTLALQAGWWHLNMGRDQIGNTWRGHAQLQQTPLAHAHAGSACALRCMAAAPRRPPRGAAPRRPRRRAAPWTPACPCPCWARAPCRRTPAAAHARASAAAARPAPRSAAPAARCQADPSACGLWQCVYHNAET